MNQKLVTLAVAAALAAPAAAMADATLYGKLHMSIDYFDIKQSDADELAGVDTFKGWTLNKGRIGMGAGRANRIGVKGSEDLGGGLKAIYQVEFGINMANEADYSIANGDAGTIQMRNSFVGLAGGFGTVLVGRHDTPMKISTGKLDLFADTMADYNGTVGFHDVRADNAIAYISPSFSGFQFAGAMVPGAASTTGGVANIDSDSLAEGYSLAAIYTNGPFYGSLAYENLSDDLTFTDEDNEKWRVGLGLLDWNGFTLTGVYENQDPDTLDINLFQVQAAYAFGNNKIKGMYGWTSRDADLDFDDLDPGDILDEVEDLFDNDRNSWAIGFDHSFSKRTTAYLLYTDVNDDNVDQRDWSGFSLGMIHNF